MNLDRAIEYEFDRAAPLQIGLAANGPEANGRVAIGPAETGREVIGRGEAGPGVTGLAATIGPAAIGRAETPPEATGRDLNRPATTRVQPHHLEMETSRIAKDRRCGTSVRFCRQRFETKKLQKIVTE